MEKESSLTVPDDSENSLLEKKKSGNNLLKDIILFTNQDKWKKIQAQPS